jgi:hypothetical protein
MLVEETRHLVETLLETFFGANGHVGPPVFDILGFGKRVVNGSLRL